MFAHGAGDPGECILGESGSQRLRTLAVAVHRASHF